MKWAIIAIFAILVLAACQQQGQYKYVCYTGTTVDKVSDCPQPKTEAPEEQQLAVTAEYLYADLQKDPKIVLIDMREKDEFEKSHLENAKNIPLGSLWKAHFFGRIPKNDPVVLYDNDGIRISVAYRELQKLGYKNVIKLAGGIRAWQEAGYLVMEGGQLQKGTPIL